MLQGELGNSGAANVLLEEQVGVQEDGASEETGDGEALLGEFALVGNHDLPVLRVVEGLLDFVQFLKNFGLVSFYIGC